MDIVYKLVRLSPKGLVSVGITERYELNYSTKAITYPKLGKIFAFSDLKSALDWYKDYVPGDLQVWVARAKISSLQVKFISSYTADIPIFWDNIWSSMLDIDLSLPLSGTIFCDSLILEGRLL